VDIRDARRLFPATAGRAFCNHEDDIERLAAALPPAG